MSYNSIYAIHNHYCPHTKCKHKRTRVDEWGLRAHTAGIGVFNTPSRTLVKLSGLKMYGKPLDVDTI
jgi:hypothetical protein